MFEFFIVFLCFIFLLIVLAVLGYRANVADWGGPGRNILDGLVRLFCFKFHRLVHEPVLLPKEGPALFVSNHISGLDPFLMVTASPRPIRFLIANEEYHRFGARWLFRLSGCIPIERNGRNEAALRAVINALRAGEVVALFPEGGIHLSNEPPKQLKRGVAKLAEMTQAPICPVSIRGVKGEGLTVSAIFKRSYAKLYTYPPLNCGQKTEEACLAELQEILNKRRKMTK